MINSDFKFDLADYLAKSGERAGEVARRDSRSRALPHARSRRRSARATPSSRARATRRGARGSSASRSGRRSRPCSPSIGWRRSCIRRCAGSRRASATAQGGSTCQVSAHSGLPALGVPAGFTDDGLPVGIDLLGAAFKEQELLSLGYAIEQTLKLRRPPFSTPALVAGKRAGAADDDRDSLRCDAEAHLRRDDVAPAVHVDAASPRAAIGSSAVWIHLGTPAKPGAARHLLFGPAQPAVGHGHAGGDGPQGAGRRSA